MYSHDSVRAVSRLCKEIRPADSNGLCAKTKRLEDVCAATYTAIDKDVNFVYQIGPDPSNLLQDIDRCPRAVQLSTLSTRSRASAAARRGRKSGVTHAVIAQDDALAAIFDRQFCVLSSSASACPPLVSARP